LFNFKKIFITLNLYGFFFLPLVDLFSLEVKSNSLNIENLLFNNEQLKFKEISKSNNFQIEKALKKELRYMEKRLLQYLIAENEVKDDISLDIESDTQYDIDNIYYAEGNVLVKFSNAELKSDFLSYDKKNKLLTVKGGVIFNKGNQYFKATSLTYNFGSKKGTINNIYGILDLKDFDIDLDIKNFSKKNKAKIKRDLSNPEDLALLSTNTFKLRNKLYDTFDAEVPPITKWRFKAKKINIINSTFNSKLVFFTNDPFNKPQFILESKDFLGEIKDRNNLVLTSNSTFIRLDDFIKFPIGKRTIQDEDFNASWGFGYKKSKDGVYVLRNHTPINFGEYTLKLESQYLLQRYLKGNTDSFRETDSSFISKKTNQSISYPDLFALKTNLSGKLYDFDLDLNASLNSFDYGRINESSTANVTLQKRLYEKGNKRNLLSSDFSFYGIYGQEEIQNAYGTRLINTYLIKNENSEKGLSLGFDLGNYFGKDIDEYKFMNTNRYGFIASTYYTFKVFDFGKDQNYSDKYRYIPSKISEQLNFGFNIASSLYEYDSNKSQSIFSFAFGPNLILGNHKKNLLDYTNVSFNTQFITKRGYSPLKFDDFDDESRYLIKIEQQIIGAITAGFESKINMKKGYFYDKVYTLNFKRRAYSLSAYKDEYDNSYGFKFNIFNFGYEGKTSEF